MRWKTIVEVTRTLLVDTTTGHAGTTAIVEAAKDVHCLIYFGFFIFDLERETLDRRVGRKPKRMKDHTEGGHKRIG